MSGSTAARLARGLAAAGAAVATVTACGTASDTGNVTGPGCLHEARLTVTRTMVETDQVPHTTVCLHRGGELTLRFAEVYDGGPDPTPSGVTTVRTVRSTLPHASYRIVADQVGRTTLRFSAWLTPSGGGLIYSLPVRVVP
jgi:hypothetical protein